MKTIYKMNHLGRMENSENFEVNNWVHLTSPSESEIEEMSSTFHIQKRLLLKLLDRSELPRIEVSHNNVLVVIDLPYTVEYAKKKKYRVMPLGIILMKNGMITIANQEHPLILDMKKNPPVDLSLENKRKFLLYLIGKSVEYYLKYLNEIQEDIRAKEAILVKSTNNKELVHMLTLEKSLVYFITSLKGNQVVLEKLETLPIMSLDEKELELLRDVKIETNQAIEMTNIYREILDGTMDTYGTVISNNLNDVMKFLTSVTLIISIPTMIASFLGMNVPLGEVGTNPLSFFFLVLISILISVVLIVILHRKNLL